MDISIPMVNLVLCGVILVLGLVGWGRSGSSLPILIGLAFGLLGLSHLTAVLGLNEPGTRDLVARIVAYLLVILALAQVAFKRK